MTFGNQHVARTVDGVAAAILAAAVAFSASAVANVLLAALLAPIAFVFARAGLARLAGQERHAVAHFDVLSIGAPRQAPEYVDEDTDDGTVVRLFDPCRPATARPPKDLINDNGDAAAQALSEALARLKQSLR